MTVTASVHDCSGQFRPDFQLADLSRRALCVLGREWLLHGHLQDRVGMPLVLEHGTREDMEAVAIDEWMAASPVYSRRTQRALNFGGDGVDTIFKNIQLDIGAPHQFLDFRFRFDSADRGEFWLPFCGALADVEPMGEEFVRGMCHTIEDPTFDATAGATHPHAQVRPVHRPPRLPSDRTPVCHWRVEVVAGGSPAVVHPNRDLVERSTAATIVLPRPDSDVAGGWPDYAGPFDPDFALEDLSHPALLTALGEVALQSHLLLRGWLLSVAQRWGDPVARAAIPRIFTGLTRITSERLCRALRIEGGGASAVARLLQIHPSLAPAGYLEATVTMPSPDRVHLRLSDSPALREADGWTWWDFLADTPVAVAALDSLVQGADARARSRCLSAQLDGHLFEITVDPDTPPAPDAPEVALGKISTGAAFLFRTLREPRL